MRRTVAGRGAAHPEAAGADGEPQRRRVRREPAPDDPARLGVDRGDAGTVLVGDPDAAAAEDDRAGAAADVDRARSRCPLGSIRRTVPARGFETQTEPSPIVTPETPRPRRGRSRSPVSVSESIPESVPSAALVTQTVVGPTARRSGGSPTAIGIGDRDAVAAEAGAQGKATAPASGSDAGAKPLRCGPRRQSPAPPAAQPEARVGCSSRAESTRVAAGRRALALAAPPRSARPALAVALGRVLGDRPLDHRVDPLRHLRLGVGLLAGVGDDPGQRLVEHAAERVDVGRRARPARRATAPAPCTRPCRRSRRRCRRRSPRYALARPKSER